jgi:hypothetical protein
MKMETITQNVTEMVITNRVDAQIDFNYEQAEQYLESLIGDMKGWIIEEDDLTFAKDTLADLNKLSKNVEDFRKKNKKEMEKPIKEFESKCKLLVDKINEVYSPLKLQYEGFEDKRKAKKKIEVMALIEEVRAKSDLPEKYSSRIVFNESYLNKTISIKQVEQDLYKQATNAFNDYKQDMQAELFIKALCEKTDHKYNLSVNLDYKNFTHLTIEEAELVIDQAGQRATLKEKEAVERIKAEEERKAKLEAEKQASEMVADTLKSTNEAMQSVSKFIPVETAEEEEEQTYQISIRTTASKWETLQRYMKQFDIPYF